MGTTPTLSHFLTVSLLLIIRHGDLDADMFDDEEGNGVEGPLEEEDEFYPESSQWEAEEEEEEEKVTKPPPPLAAAAAAITEKVTCDFPLIVMINSLKEKFMMYLLCWIVGYVFFCWITREVFQCSCRGVKTERKCFILKIREFQIWMSVL